MEKLQASLHFIDEGDELPKKKKSKHIVFVDSEKEAKEFSPVKHLDTLPELVNRKFNRPRMDTLKKSDILATHSGKELKEIKKEREMKFKELASRMKREEEMQRAEQELTLQRALRVSILGLRVISYAFNSKREERRLLERTSMAWMYINGSKSAKNKLLLLNKTNLYSFIK